MKQNLFLAATFLLLLGALVLSQLRRAEAPVGPTSLLYFIGDTERELTRIPMVYTRIPDGDEIKAGQGMAASYTGLGSQSDPEVSAIQTYVRQVGTRLTAKARRKLPYEFHYVVEPDFVNAFALPGGQVVLGGGLVALMETEAELAAVLAHEIEHVDHFHCAERLQLELALRKIPLGGFLRIPAQVFQAGYTKEQELEADREGTRLAVLADYSPAGAIRVLERFEELNRHVIERPKTPQEELSKVAAEILRGYFASHPSSADRIDQLKRIFGNELTASHADPPLRFAYVYVRQQAARQLDLATQLTPADRRAKEAYGEAAKLASRTIDMIADTPGLPPLVVTAGQVLALRILALAQLGLFELADAALSYRKLVELDPRGADAIRGSADDLAARALAADEFRQAADLAEFSLKLQPNQPAALKTLALARLFMGESSTATEVSLNLNRLYPAAGSELAKTLQETGQRAFVSGKYSDAIRFLNLSHTLKPDDSTRRAVADALFANGDFLAAAEAYRSLFREQTPDPDLVRGWADAVGALGRPAQAAGELRVWAERAVRQNAPVSIVGFTEEQVSTLFGPPSLRQSGPDGMTWYYDGTSNGTVSINIVGGKVVRMTPDGMVEELQRRATGRRSASQSPTASARASSATQVSIEIAGLQVLAGDDTLARTLIAQAIRPQSIAIAPEHLVRLAWWYTKAGRAREATDFVRAASQMRPGDAGLQNSDAWAEWEAGHLEEAARRIEFALRASASSYALGNTPQMARALVKWSSHQSDAALDDFDQVSKQFPAWLNAAWVRAVYPARVAEVVQEFHIARAAEVEFGQANFPLARDLLRSLVETHANDRGLLRRYAEALSALDRKQAITEFQAFLERANIAADDVRLQVRLDVAGLKLLARVSTDAEAIARALRPEVHQGLDPEMLARLAWWYFRAGSTPAHMETLLRAAIEQRPGDPLVENALAWLELERGNISRAMDGFSRIASGTHLFFPGNLPAIGRAIAFWRSQPANRAASVAVFSSIVADSPQWLIPEWVAALCPDHVVQVVTELRAARKKESHPTVQSH